MYIQQYTKTIAEPFARAAVLTADAITYGVEAAVVDSVRLYSALTSERAIAIYETIWLLCQLAFWLTVLAAEYAVKAGRAFRRYCQAEWATDVAWLVQQIWSQEITAAEPVEIAAKPIEEAQPVTAATETAEAAKVMAAPEPVAQVSDATSVSKEYHHEFQHPSNQRAVAADCKRTGKQSQATSQSGLLRLRA